MKLFCMSRVEIKLFSSDELHFFDCTHTVGQEQKQRNASKTTQEIITETKYFSQTL